MVGIRTFLSLFGRRHRVAALVCLGLLLLSTASSAGDGKPVLFVFDLDDTLIRWVRPDESAPSGQVIPAQGDINGYRYRVLNGSGELIQSLLHDVPGARIAFFSAGERDRNLKILKELRLPDGRRALDIAERILSKEDVTQVSDGTSTKKVEMKDLRKMVSSEVDLDHVILIDDNPNWILPGQEANFLWVGSDPSSYQAGHSSPGSRKFDEKRKLIWARGLIERMLQRSEKDAIPPRQALKQEQWRDSEPYRFTENKIFSQEPSFFEEGAKFFKTSDSRPDVRCIESFLETHPAH